MNGWPTDEEVKNALEQGILLNVGRCPPHPTQTPKQRIAAGMGIAGIGTYRDNRTLSQWLNDRVDLAITAMYCDGRWHQIIAAGMSSR